MSSPDSNTPAPAPKPAGTGKAEPRSMEQNLMLAIGLAAMVMVATQYFLPQPAPPPAQKKAAVTEANASGASSPAPAATASPTPAAVAANAHPIAGQAEQTHVIETDVYRVTFTNRGAVVRNWVLKKYKDLNDKPLDLVNSKAAGKLNLPFSIEDLNSKPIAALNDALYTMTTSSDGLGVDFEFSDGTNYAKKSFHFAQGRYTVDVASTVREGNVPTPHMLAWIGGFGDFTVIGAGAKQRTVFYDSNQNSTILGIPTGKGKLVVKTASDASDGPQVNRGSYTFAGLNDAYFAAVALPEASADFRVTAVANKLPNHQDGKEEAYAGALIGGEAENRFPMFIGPKDIDLMRGISPRLDTMVDWGWWGAIAKPLFWFLHQVNDHFTHNWGWAIVLVTILINVVTVPLRLSGLKSSQKMASVQPEIKKLQDKYAGMSVRDPRRSKQNEEMMAIYSKHGISPVSGCIPQLLILPVALAFYAALTTVIEIRGANWLWVSDLSRPETLAIRVLPVLMLITQLLTLKFSPTPGGDPTQQRMMMLMMPIMLVLVMYQQSSGLVLYWLTSNVIGIAQQLIFNRLMPAKPLPATAVKAIGKKK